MYVHFISNFPLLSSYTCLPYTTNNPGPATTEFITAIAQREIATAKANLQYPLTPTGLFNGPRQYKPTLSKKLSALHNYLKVAPHVLPSNKATHAAVLWHGDLHAQNIFVDSTEPARIVGIIDWQSVSACPLFMQVRRPALLDYDGPVPEELGRVSLPAGFEGMDPDEQKKAKALRQAQTLHNLYLVRWLQAHETVFQAIQEQNKLRYQVSIVPGLTLMDYEPLLNSLLRDLEKDWERIVGGSSPFPVQLSEQEVQQQERDGELWAQGVELMDAFVRDTGCFKHWDGRVSDGDYEQSRRELDEGVMRFLDREARNEEERREWLKVLSFVD